LISGFRFHAIPAQEQCTIAFKVDVATTEDHADALSLQLGTHLPGGGKAQATRGLNYELHALGEKAHALDQLLIRDRENVIHIALNDGEGVIPKVLRLSTVGYRIGCCDVDDDARSEGPLPVIPRLRLDTI
jgi:hypothetical protein